MLNDRNRRATDSSRRASWKLRILSTAPIFALAIAGLEIGTHVSPSWRYIGAAIGAGLGAIVTGWIHMYFRSDETK